MSIEYQEPMNREKKMYEEKYNKIKKVLMHADNAPYYHALFEKANIDLKNFVSYDEFMKIPITDKNIYNDNKVDMIVSGLNGFEREEYEKCQNHSEKKKYLKEHGIMMRMTSGSTGQPLCVLKTYKDNYRDYFMLNVYRRKLADYDFNGQFVQIWPVNRVVFEMMYPDSEKVDYVRFNENGYMFFLIEHSEENLMKLYSFIKEKGCEWITSSPTLLYKLSSFMKKNNLQLENIRYIECHSEKLYDWQREEISSIFEAEISSIYSSNEVQFIAGQCSNGKMHLFSKGCFLEIITTETGNKELVLTSLNYLDIPIIRYRIGDCGTWLEGECECKFNKEEMFELYGFRKNDMIKTHKGDIEPFVITDSMFYVCNVARINVKMYKVKQTSLDCFCYYIEKDVIDSNGERLANIVQDFLKKALQNSSIEVKVEEFNLDDTSLGRKFKYFECCI